MKKTLYMSGPLIERGRALGLTVSEQHSGSAGFREVEGRQILMTDAEVTLYLDGYEAALKSLGISAKA